MTFKDMAGAFLMLGAYQRAVLFFLLYCIFELASARHF
jgi:hypothetical protein